MATRTPTLAQYEARNRKAVERIIQARKELDKLGEQNGKVQARMAKILEGATFGGSQNRRIAEIELVLAESRLVEATARLQEADDSLVRLRNMIKDV